MSGYARPPGDLPPQTELLTGRAACNEFYAVIPGRTMRRIVTSRLPGWRKTRLWMLARPLSGFAETFSHYVMEVEAGGGSERPEPDPGCEAILFVTHGNSWLTVAGRESQMVPGSYAYLAPGEAWSLQTNGESACVFHWIRKSYVTAGGLEAPESFVTREQDIAPDPFPEAGDVWSTTRFVDPEDLRHDMHVNIVTLQPGATIPFEETHVMEHGLYILEGKGVYRLNRDWVEVEAGDFIWLRAFCPQACYAGGPGPFRYLLYKDVNRHASLRPGPADGGDG